MLKCHFSLGRDPTVSLSQVTFLAVTSGIAILGILAGILSRRQTRPKRTRNRTIGGGRRTRNSMRSPNGSENLSLALLLKFLNDIFCRCFIGRWISSKCAFHLTWWFDTYHHRYCFAGVLS